MQIPMDEWGPLQRLRYALPRAAGLGAIAAGFELVALTRRLKLSLSLLDLLLLGAVDALLLGALASLLALLLAPLQWALARRRPSRALALHLAAVSFGLLALFLWPIAAGLDGPKVVALAFGFLPLGFAGVVYFNAAYWLRRVEIGVPVALGWLPLSAGASGLMVLGAAGAYLLRDTGGAYALDDDRNVVLITIDTLRRDHVGVYGYEVGAGLTPNLDALAARGVVFEDAVSPSNQTTPAHATLLSGLHPLRHRVLLNSQSLARGFRTLPETLDRQGFATGAFVSSFAVDARRGLDQGFRTYDDDFTACLPGVTRLSLVALAVRAWVHFGNPAATPWLLERDDAATVAHFERWLGRHADVPFFAWVHLFSPHAPYEGSGVDHRARLPEGDDVVWTEAERASLRAQYADEVRAADAQLGVVLAALDSYDLNSETLVIVVADHGESLGEHGIDFQHHGLYDEVVRVPLILAGPGIPVARVAPQVRLMDVPATALEFLGLDPAEGAEGVELIGYASGRRHATMWCALVGPVRGGGPLALGLRNNGVKYLADPESGEEALYDLREDPAEADDRAAVDSDTVIKARGLLAGDRAALQAQEAELESSGGAMLRALGYLR